MINYNSDPYRINQTTVLLLVHLFRSVPQNMLLAYPNITRNNLASWKKAGYIEKDSGQRFASMVTTTKKLYDRFYNVPVGRKSEFFTNHDIHVFACMFYYLRDLNGRLVELEREKFVNNDLKPDITLKIKVADVFTRVYVEVETGTNSLDKCLKKIREYNNHLKESMEDNEVHFYVPRQIKDKYLVLETQAEGYKMKFFDLYDMPDPDNKELTNKRKKEDRGKVAITELTNEDV